MSLARQLQEIKTCLDDLPDDLFRRDHGFIEELVRGVKYMRQASTLATPATSFQFSSPASGYAWDVKMISGTLSANDSVAAYVGDGVNNRLIGYAPPPGAAPAQFKFVLYIPSHAAVVFPGEPVFIQTSGAGNLVMAMISAIEVPAEMIGKVIL